MISELFQEDLYPDTLADVPAITGDEWWSGENADPIVIPMIEVTEKIGAQKVSNLGNPFKVVRMRLILYIEPGLVMM